MLSAARLSTLAVLAAVLYWGWGRNTRSDTARQSTWIFAASAGGPAMSGIVARASYRFVFDPDYRPHSVGFRVVCVAPLP